VATATSADEALDRLDDGVGCVVSGHDIPGSTGFELLDAVADAHERMHTLIDDLLTLAQQGDEVGTLEPVDFDALVERCWRSVETDDATLDHRADRTIRADPNRLQQLLENLFRNSVEHGSRATPETADEPVVITVGDLPGGFCVADDGPGIPADERERAFEAGCTTSEDGTGFGLRIVERIAEAHGWSVAATESEAGGARFEVTGVSFVEP